MAHTLHTGYAGCDLSNPRANNLFRLKYKGILWKALLMLLVIFLQ